MKKFLSIFIIVCVIIGVCGCKSEESVPVSAPVTEEKEPEYISIVAAGDNLYHMPVVNSGKTEDGSYNYSSIYSQLQPMIRDADISVIGQETIFGGKERGYSGYPLFNSPTDIGDTIASEGFDVVLHASNHAMDQTVSGIENTIEFWKKYPEITVLGIHGSEEEYNQVVIKELKGAKLALLNYTYDTNGIPVPSDKYYMVELIDEEKIERDALYAEENADFTIAFMHWGTEYATKPNEMQKELSYKMADWGVDLIIGAHPHVIEPVEKITTEKGNSLVVYYSLGNFVSRQLNAINLLGGVSKINLKCFDGEVEIDEYTLMPVVTHYNTAHNSFKIYPLAEYTDDIAAGHGVAAHDGAVSKERFMNIVDEIFEGYDTKILEY